MKYSFTLVFKYDPSTKSKSKFLSIIDKMFVNAPKYELLRKDKFLVILVTLNHKDYNNWINVECEIKGKNRISIDYLDVGYVFS